MRDVFSLRNGESQVTVATAGGAILHAAVAGRPLLMPSESPCLATQIHGGEACFPLVPFGGRIEGNGFRLGGVEHRLTPNTPDPLVLHGDGWLRNWSLGHVSETSVDLHLDMHPVPASPYAYRARQRVEALPQGVRLSLSVENRGPALLPFGLGFHPYLPVEPGSLVAFEAGGVWTERDMHLPGERRSPAGMLDFSLAKPVPDSWINSCFDEWNGLATIRHADGVTITLSADPLFRWLMVYKPAGDPNFLCLEPMSHRPNGFTHPEEAGLALLQTGDRLQGAMSLQFA